MPKKMTPNQINEIIRLYQAGTTPTEIGQQFDIYNNSVTRILRKKGILRTQAAPKVPQDTIDKIIQMYQKGISSEIIAREFNINGSTVCRILKRKGIDIRPAQQNKRKYDIDENFFEVIDNEAKAYFLGFLYADGNLSSTSGSIRIELHPQDIDVLEKFSDLIYGFKKISKDRHKNGTDYLFCAVYCQKMHADLCKLGCPPAKTFLITFPTFEIVPEHLMHHFIRGYFDGDGHIGLDDHQNAIIDFTSNEQFIKELIIFIEKTLNIKCNKMGTRKDKNSKNIQFTNNVKIKILLDYVYKDASIFMDRKKKLVEQFLYSYDQKTNKHNNFDNYGTCYIPSFMGMQLTNENLAKMPAEQKEEAANYLADFYRQNGFPYPTLSNDEILSDLIKLKKIDSNSILKENNIISLNNTTGIPTFKHFAPHFYEVNSNLTNKKSMLDTFNDDNMLLKVIKNRLYQNYNMTGNMLKQGLPNSKVAYKASIFYPILAKFIYEKYCKDNDIIYDYSMGFGQRLLGSLSLPFKIKYVGVDVDKRSVESNQNIYNFHKQYIPGFDKEVELYCIGSEKFCPEKYYNKVNVAFSSPPYWNIEKYSNEENQATNYSYVDFINKWWRQVVDNIDKLLTKDGYFILNIEDHVLNFEIKNDMSNTIKRRGFEIEQEYQMQITKNLQFNNKSGKHKYEPIIVFRRISNQ